MRIEFSDDGETAIYLSSEERSLLRDAEHLCRETAKALQLKKRLHPHDLLWLNRSKKVTMTATFNPPGGLIKGVVRDDEAEQ